MGKSAVSVSVGLCEFPEHLALPLRFSCNMKCAPSFWSLLLVLATPAAVGAETTIYFLEHPMEVPAPLVLFVGGLALLGVGGAVRRWRARAPTPEAERSDQPPLDQAVDSPIKVVGSPVSGAAETVPGRTDPSEEVVARLS
jgi:hypothetical protein